MIFVITVCPQFLFVPTIFVTIIFFELLIDFLFDGLNDFIKLHLPCRRHWLSTLVKQ